MNATYKITLKSQLFIIRELFVFAWPCRVGYYVLDYLYPGDDTFLLEWLAGGFFVIQILPSAIIHFQYLNYNKDTIVTVNSNERTITIEEKGVIHSFRFEKIKSLRLALMADLYNGHDGGFIACLKYHYAYIELQNGDEFIITCLVYNDLRKFFKDIGLEANKDLVFFPGVRMARYMRDEVETV